MMKVTFSIVIGLIVNLSQAQMAFKQDSLNFAATTELNTSQQSVMIYNNGVYPINVNEIILFNLFNYQPFTLSTTAFSLAPADSFELVIDFLPEHNIKHNMALVVKSNSGFGHEAILLKGQGQYSKSYYSSTQDLSEEALKTALKARLAQGYNSLSYSVARDNMYATIDNVAGTVTCAYTGRTATFNSRSGANNNSFNCEHTFPQGKFNQALPMRSDIHHLFPTDVAANSRRGNDPFGVVGNASWSVGGSKSGGGLFEPRDPQKGATARAMMYFVIRYQDYTNHFAGQEGVLRNWHKLYPPSAAEQSRNSAIFNVQNNRNPFVDYPQFEERITNIIGNSVAPSRTELYLSDDTLKLARGNGNYTYNFVVYNSGNEPITISNFTLSDPTLAMNLADITLGPGQKAELPISFDGSQNYNASLQFTDDASPANTYDLPIVSGPILSNSEDVLPKLNFYPNPAKGLVHFTNAEDIAYLQFCNPAGTCITKKTASEVDVSNLAAGFYLITGVLKSGVPFTGKLVLR